MTTPDHSTPGHKGAPLINTDPVGLIATLQKQVKLLREALQGLITDHATVGQCELAMQSLLRRKSMDDPHWRADMADVSRCLRFAEALQEAGKALTSTEPKP